MADLSTTMTGDLLSLPAGVRAVVLGSGKAGHEMNCLGVARALGLDPVVVPVRPRRFYAALAPFGPIDPRDRSSKALLPPFPDIVFASGRVTVPYFRAVKRRSGGRVFCVFLQDPRWARSAADLIWAPEHDRLRGERVITTLTSPHTLRSAALEEARREPDPRVGRLSGPRLAMLLGGPSDAYRFGPTEAAALAQIARSAVDEGFSVMATPSRRTPAALTQAVRQALTTSGGEGFIWDGGGANPYLSILAKADSILVTGDSVNMVGEALATRAPVQIFEPAGGDAKMRRFLDALVRSGQARRWAGRFERWQRQPLDATGEIARAVYDRFLEFRAGLTVSS